MDIAHCTLPRNTIKNLRTDCRLDDGTPSPIEDNKRYAVQNTGAGEVRISERADTRGMPSIESNDVMKAGNREWTYIDTKPNSNYYVWALGQDSVIALSEMN